MNRPASVVTGLMSASILVSCVGRVISSPSSSPLPASQYERSIDVANGQGLDVWLESDLTKRWLAGRSEFLEGIARLADLASRPGVMGFKIADELGYKDGFDNDARRIQAFLNDSARELRAAAPGKRILVDMLVPELGCAPAVVGLDPGQAACRAAARIRFPALRLEAVDGYLASGALDAVNLSTGILSEEAYRSWGTDRQSAQLAAWREAVRRGWHDKVDLRSRRAMAHPGAYSMNSQEAASDVHAFVDLPLESGATAVDIWTWRQLYNGEIYHLMDPDMHSNTLWTLLGLRHRAGSILSTHFTPSSTEQSITADLAAIGRVFSAVFVAAGIG
jgi:hypothetical protein